MRDDSVRGSSSVGVDSALLSVESPGLATPSSGKSPKRSKMEEAASNDWETVPAWKFSITSAMGADPATNALGSKRGSDPASAESRILGSKASSK
jgi:hypothetical protein